MATRSGTWWARARQQGCGPQEAFDLLRQASQHSNFKVHELAELIVEQAASGIKAAMAPVRSASSGSALPGCLDEVRS